jgi:hypothetical protein
MVRRYGDPVDVRPAGDPDAAPGSFLWRGRLYVVRSVLGHWCERRAWWNAAAARAVHGEGTSGADSSALEAEREVWRVEAGAGRSFGVGVYDLCRDPVSDESHSGQSWVLLQVSD